MDQVFRVSQTPSPHCYIPVPGTGTRYSLHVREATSRLHVYNKAACGVHINYSSDTDDSQVVAIKHAGVKQSS